MLPLHFCLLPCPQHVSWALQQLSVQPLDPKESSQFFSSIILPSQYLVPTTCKHGTCVRHGDAPRCSLDHETAQQLGKRNDCEPHVVRVTIELNCKGQG